MINRIIASILPLFPKKIIWLFSKRYIAGETRESAFKIVRQFNNDGIMTSLDVLGEFETKREKIDFYKSEYIKTIEEADKAKLETSFSLKPTMFGLLLDNELCHSHIYEILKLVAEKNRMLRIDMEDSPCTDLEIELFEKLYKEFPQNIGLVLQAYLKRTKTDLERLSRISQVNNPVNIRLCKGIYIEPEEIAYKDKKEINHHFTEDLDFMFRNGFYPAIATHDKKLIEASLSLISKYNVPRDKYEFQMLYGVTPELRKSLVSQGHHMRIYVPFGKDWLNYSLRRLKENPRMITDILKALIFRN